MSREDDEFDWHAWKQKAPRKKKRVPFELPRKPQKTVAYGFFSLDEKGTKDPARDAATHDTAERRRKRKWGRALPK
jgi:hypothetical protein